MQNTAVADSVNAIVTLYNKENNKKKFNLELTVRDKKTGDVVLSQQLKKVQLGDSTTFSVPLKLANA